MSCYCDIHKKRNSVLFRQGQVSKTRTCNIQRRFQQINQLDAKISQVYYLTFMYSSTCFGRPHAHHQEFNNCSSSLWFYRWSEVVAVLLVVVGPACPTTTKSTESPSETCRVIFNKLEKWCI